MSKVVQFHSAAVEWIASGTLMFTPRVTRWPFCGFFRAD